MASTITTSVVTGGTNNHATSVADINNPVTDFVNPGVVGTVTPNTGSGGSGSFAVNAQGTPAMFVDVRAGSAYIAATPAGQISQNLRAKMASDYVSYAISSNASGSTKFDFIYLKVDPTAANNPASDASDVTALYTSRSSISTADNGSPPTYGILLAVVTVSNGASSITNSAISDRRTNASLQTVSANTFFFDFVESGCLWTPDSAGVTLNASMTSGFVWVSGSRLSVQSVSARAFTASRDTYIDLSDNGDGTASFTYTTVTNNAASPALSSGSIRIGIVVAGSSNIAAVASINQGQTTAVLPIASSIAYTVTDSLGNLICPRDPQRKVIGYRQVIANQTLNTGTYTDITGLSVPVIVPANRNINVSGKMPAAFNSTNGAGVKMNVYDVTASAQLTEDYGVAGASSAFLALFPNQEVTPPASGARTYKAQVAGYGIGTAMQTNNNGVYPVWVKVELA